MNPSYERGLLLHQQRRFADAESEFKQVLAGDPQNAPAHAMLSLCLAERNEFEQATAEADAAIGLSPDLAFAHYARARVLNDRNRFEEAGAAINEALRFESFNPHYYALQAGIRFSQRRWADALAAAEDGLAIDPEDAGCVNMRAMSLVQLGRKEEAGAAIGAALRRDPHNAVTHANQGWALLHRGQHEQALEHFREALRLDPESDWARAGMVEALKARHLVYRIMLRYFLWMSRLGRGAQWGIIIGLYIGFQILSGTARSQPQLRPIIWPLLIAYGLFAYLTWVASPLFNLLLRLSRFGRYVLSRQQRISSNWIGGTLLCALISMIVFAITFRIEAVLAAAYFMLMVLPLTGLFRVPEGWPRGVMGLYTAGLALLGAGAIAVITLAARGAGPGADTASTMATTFLIGIFVEGWVANALAGVRVTK